MARLNPVLYPKDAGIQRLWVVGFFTNVCVETTVRMAGNMGFDTYLVHDACSTMNSIGLDGTDYDPELVHNMAVAGLHGDFLRPPPFQPG